MADHHESIGNQGLQESRWPRWSRAGVCVTEGNGTTGRRARVARGRTGPDLSQAAARRCCCSTGAQQSGSRLRKRFHHDRFRGHSTDAQGRRLRNQHLGADCPSSGGGSRRHFLQDDKQREPRLEPLPFCSSPQKFKTISPLFLFLPFFFFFLFLLSQARLQPCIYK